jgi:F0F1-type ATP synthase assembly protein I
MYNSLSEDNCIEIYDLSKSLYNSQVANYNHQFEMTQYKISGIMVLCGLCSVGIGYLADKFIRHTIPYYIMNGGYIVTFVGVCYFFAIGH